MNGRARERFEKANGKTLEEERRLRDARAAERAMGTREPLPRPVVFIGQDGAPLRGHRRRTA
jgi:hypothetical protein